MPVRWDHDKLSSHDGRAMCRRPTINANCSFRDHLVVTQELYEYDFRIDLVPRVEQDSALRHIQRDSSDCIARWFPLRIKAMAY